MSRGHLQGEQMTEAGRVVLPWGRMLNNELSTLISRYGEMVGNLLDKYGSANAVAIERVDEFKNFVEQLGAMDDGRIIAPKATREGAVSTTRPKTPIAAVKTADECTDKKLEGRIRSKAVSLLHRAYEAWMISESARPTDLPNEEHRTRREAGKLISIARMRLASYDWIRKLLPIGQSPGTTSQGNQMPESSHRRTVGSDAEFLGWQKTSNGESVALYNVTAERHPLYRSTVSEKTLVREKLEVPPTPHRER